MLLDEYVNVKVANNVKRYENLGYEIPKKINKKGKLVYDQSKFIKIKVSDLSRRSGVKVNVKCDYCGKEYTLNFNNYQKQIKKDGLLCCYDCRQQKASKTIKEKYGVDNVMQLKEIREKAEQTCFERYGAKHALQTEKSKEHYRNTCLEKYGVTNTLCLPEVQEKRKKHVLKNMDMKILF